MYCTAVSSVMNKLILPTSFVTNEHFYSFEILISINSLKLKLKILKLKIKYLKIYGMTYMKFHLY